MATTIQNPRAQKIFCIIETTEGTLKKPTSGSFLVPAGYVDLSQTPNFSDSEEIINSRDVTDRFQGRWNPGEFTIPMYLRPSGTAGTAPDGDVLFTSLMGLKTVDPGVSVTYSQTVDKTSFSLWRKLDDVVLWARGCVVTGLKLGLQTGAGGAMVSFTGQFAELGWCGTGAVEGAHSSLDTTVELESGHSKRFKKGSFVEFESESVTYNNSNAGYEITDINYTTDIITIGTGLEHALVDAAIIRPWLPTETEVGAPLEMSKGYIKIDDATKTIKGLDLSINDPITYLNEITQDSYPATYAGTRRDISGTITKMMRLEDVEDFYLGGSNTSIDLDVIIGDTAGSICTINTPKTEIEFPSLANVDPTVEESIKIKALATNGEDSCTIKFT